MPIEGQSSTPIDRRIVVVGSALANRRVSGTINVKDTDEALTFVIKVLGAKATRFGPLIFIR